MFPRMAATRLQPVSGGKARHTLEASGWERMRRRIPVGVKCRGGPWPYQDISLAYLDLFCFFLNQQYVGYVRILERIRHISVVVSDTDT